MCKLPDGVMNSEADNLRERTEQYIPSCVPTQPDQQTEFTLGFLPDKSLAAVTRLGDNIATVLDIKFGDPRLIIDTGMRICGLRVIGSVIVVVGNGKIVTWHLPVGNYILDARANVNDSVRTIMCNQPAPPFTQLYSASISLDPNCIVIVWGGCEGLDIYDMPTGKHLVGTTAFGYMPWFTPDGREVWSLGGFSVRGSKIAKDNESNAIRLEHLWSAAPPSKGFPWRPHGHEVTDDEWILNWGKKRFIWLPNRWRMRERDLTEWDG